MMYECLPPRWRNWVADRAAAEDLPEPDLYLLHLVRADWHARDLNRTQLWSWPETDLGCDDCRPARANGTPGALPAAS